MNSFQIQSENEEFKAKEQLYALFYELTSEVKGKEIELDEEQYINNINTIKIPQLIKYLRDIIQILIKRQFDIDINRRKSSPFASSISEDERKQYELIISHLEAKERRHIKKLFEQCGTKEVLESRLIDYIEMERDFDVLKEKVKYEEGRFLTNERKDNEIIIIRSENTILKKAITELEEKERKYDREIAEQDALIEQLKDSRERYKNELEKTKKDLKLFSNININISNSGAYTAISSHNNIKQSKCSLCGCPSSKPPGQEKDKGKSPLYFKLMHLGDQTQFKMFNLKKLNNQNQKAKIQYNLNQIDGSLSNTHITFDLLSNKASSSTGKNITLQHNHSMNLMLDKYKGGDSLNMNLNSTRLMNNRNINPYCMKITKLPINQSRCPVINKNSIDSKRTQSVNKVVMAKKPFVLMNNKSHLNSTVSKGEL